MKKAGKIICYITAGLLILISLIFIVIEGRTLFSGDWSIYENSVNGFFRYLFRFIIAIFTMALSIFTYFALNKKESKILHIYYYIGAITLLISAIIISIYSTNYLNILFIVLASLYFFGASLYYCSSYLKH